VARLIAVAGGVELQDMGADQKDKASFGSPSGLPVLQHGNLKMAQSIAIEEYLAKIAPKYADLTAAERARDSMMLCIKEDILAGMAKIIFGDMSKAPEEVPKVLDRWLPIVEGQAPSSGFFHGRSFPTPADLAVLCLVDSYMPFGSAIKHGKIDTDELWAKYPKTKALAERAAQAEGVKQYLQSSKTMKGAMPGK
jgi:glutathione S-transferase